MSLATAVLTSTFMNETEFARELPIPAYMYGVENYARHNGASFDKVESDLARDWQRAKGKSRLGWEEAKEATRDSWQRVSDTIERAAPGDSDRDGK